MNEIWKTIQNHPMFQVSNMGRVRRKRGLHTSSHLLKQSAHGRVTFCQNGKQSTSLVYSLVLAAFAPQYASYHAVHKDGNIKNNRLSNLKPWASAPKQRHSSMIFYPVTYYRHSSAMLRVTHNGKKGYTHLSSFLYRLGVSHSQTEYTKLSNSLLRNLSLTLNGAKYTVVPQTRFRRVTYCAFLNSVRGGTRPVQLSYRGFRKTFVSVSLAALWIAYRYHYSRESAKEVLLYNIRRDRKFLGYQIKLLSKKK